MTRNVRILKVLLGIGVSASLVLGIRDAVAAPTARGYCTDPLATGYCVTAASCQQVCRDAGLGSYLALCNFSSHCCYCDPDV